MSETKTIKVEKVENGFYTIGRKCAICGSGFSIYSPSDPTIFCPVCLKTLRKIIEREQEKDKE